MSRDKLEDNKSLWKYSQWNPIDNDTGLLNLKNGCVRKVSKDYKIILNIVTHTFIVCSLIPHIGILNVM